MKGISSQAAGSLENKYKFGDKELQHQEFSDGSGLEEYDFGARLQDPQLGVWHNIDPHAINSYSWSPYNYVYDNPFNLIDPNGMDGGDVYGMSIADLQNIYGANNVQVLQYDNGGSKDDALKAIDNFANDPNNTVSVFPKISKESFVNDLRTIIQNPQIAIRQNNNGTCGAAILCKLMAELSPLDFVNAAIGLYQSGFYTQNNMILAVTQNMKSQGANELSPVNTVMQGAITNANNKWLSYNPNTDGSGISSFTYPGFVDDFLTKFLGVSFEKTEYPSTSSISNIDYKSNFIIGEVHLNGNDQLSSALVANHYLQITGVQTANGRATINFWSWGRNNSSTVNSNYFNGVHSIWIIKK